MDPATAMLAIGGAGSLFGAGTSFMGAQKQNAALRQSMASQQAAAQQQMGQVAQAAAVEREKRLKEAQQIQGRIRVAAGEAGIGMGGSIAALSRQSELDLGTNLAIIDQNYANNIAAIRSGAQANLQSLSSQIGNPILNAFSGAFSGAGTGLAIGGAVGDWMTLQNTPKPTRQQVKRPII